MTARRATLTETEIRRVLKAAKAEGFSRVELTRSSKDGLKIVIEQEAKGEPVETIEELE
jgi:hypothetical protein